MKKIAAAILMCAAGMACGQQKPKDEPTLNISGTFQVQLTADQMSLPGNEWIKPCGPANNAKACFQADEMQASGGERVVRLSGDDYAHLQKLRKAVTDAETEIAKEHGVHPAVFDPCPRDTNLFCGEGLRQADHFEFRGQFLLVNVPEAHQ